MSGAVTETVNEWLPRLLKVIESRLGRKSAELDRLADVFGDPEDLARLYVEPDCQQFNPADDDEDEAGHVVRQPVYERVQAFVDGAASTTPGMNQLFVLADSGMGKTSLLLMLKLAHLNQILKTTRSCTLLKLGTNTLDDIVQIKSKRRTILLLDALDEDPSAWGRVRPRIKEVLSATKMFRKVIITCRTQFFSAGEDPFNNRGRVELDGMLCPVVYLSLFSDWHVLAYLRNRFGNDKEKIDQAQDLVKRMGSLRMRPMLLAHIDDLVEGSSDQVWTEFAVYHVLVEAWLRREHRKELSERRMPSPRDLWRACSGLAVHLQRKGRREIQEADLDVLSASDPAIGHIKTLDLSSRSLLNKNSSGAFRFSHYSVQEFLVADAAVNGKGLPSGTRGTEDLLRFMHSWRETGNTSSTDVLRLDHIDFSGVEFAPKVLENLDLRAANLEGCDLSGKTLLGIDFSRADLTGARLPVQHCETVTSRDPVFARRISATPRSRIVRSTEPLQTERSLRTLRSGLRPFDL